jgi:PadR family transcriptional regulator PadR
LFPALHRMQEQGWLRSSWGDSENNRRAKYYELTKGGRQQLEAEVRNWDRISLAMTRTLEAT